MIYRPCARRISFKEGHVSYIKKETAKRCLKQKRTDPQTPTLIKGMGVWGLCLGDCQGVVAIECEGGLETEWPYQLTDVLKICRLQTHYETDMAG